MTGILISIANLSNRFFIGTNSFITQVPDAREISRTDAVRLVYAMLQDAVAARMLWRAEQGYFGAVCERFLPWFNLMGSDRHSSQFIYHVIDHIDLGMHDLLLDVVPPHDWRLWSVQHFRYDSVILTPGEDWRALEYERLMTIESIRRQVEAMEGFSCR